MCKSVNKTFKRYKTQIGFIWILYPEWNLVDVETKENNYIWDEKEQEFKCF